MPRRTRAIAQRPTTSGPSAPGAVAAAHTSSGIARARSLDVRAFVAVLGHRLAAPERDHGGAEVPDLRTRVVEVVLAGDLLAAGLEHPAQQVPDERAAGVADGEWPGRVGRHELDVDPARVDRGDAAPAWPERPGCRRRRASYAASATRMLRNPGRATSTPAMSPGPAAAPLRSASARTSAIASGGRRSGRASFIARLVARSPNAGFAGRSTSMAGVSASSPTAGSRPAIDRIRPCPPDGVRDARAHGGDRSGRVELSGHGSSWKSRAGVPTS